MDILAVVQRAKASRDPSILTSAVPYARFLSIGVEALGDEIIGRMKFSPDLVGNVSLPALHGGTIGALLESTAIFHLLWAVEPKHVPKTINITIDYLRSAGPLDTFAQGTITRHGRRVANVRVEAWQTERDRPVAAAHAHFLMGG